MTTVEVLDKGGDQLIGDILDRQASIREEVDFVQAPVGHGVWRLHLHVHQQWLCAAFLEVLVEPLCIHCCRHEDDLEILASRQQLRSQECQQDVDEDGPLVNFVDDDVSEGEATREELQHRSGSGHKDQSGPQILDHVATSNLVSDLLANLRLPQLRHSPREARGGDSSRLHAGHPSTVDLLHDHPRDGRALAAARGGDDDEDLVVVDGLQDLLAPTIDLRRVANRGDPALRSVVIRSSWCS
mmetsp:Transcript_72215/g.194597  ORF Transcript_72215/g.194597 Transcript_72215/m.194597 type:complete len:242 (-) Transcript_72215:81-806(-)